MFRIFIPGANGQTIVAAIYPVPDQWPQVALDMRFRFNCKVRDAACGIELVGRRKGIGWAYIKTGGTGPAAPLFPGV